MGKWVLCAARIPGGEGVGVADVQVGMYVGSILHSRYMLGAYLTLDICWEHNTDEHGHEACILATRGTPAPGTQQSTPTPTVPS